MKRQDGFGKFPTVEELEQELERERFRCTYKKTFQSTIYVLLVTAAIAVLAATIFVPVLRIYGTSMTPSLEPGDLVVALKNREPKRQDMIAFYYNNKILVKRVIAKEGDWVDIDSSGNVTVNGKEQEEPYVKEKSLGDCDITLPYQVPDGKVFVMGDHRSVSMDSRNSVIGCVSEEQIIGKLVVRIWPISRWKAIG